MSTKAQGHRGFISALSSPGRRTACLAVVLMLGTVGCSLAHRPAASVAASGQGARASARAPRLSVGVTTWNLAINSSRPWRPRDLAQVVAFERLTHVHASIVMWYADWRHGRIDLAQLRAVSRRGSVPEITWEPWDSWAGVRQPRYTLASIIAGRHDAYIRRSARALRAYGKPVLLRFAQEMNGTWYPWAERANGNRPGQFATAWRHVWRIFARQGTRNVRWVWSPVARGGFPLSTREYPGRKYVDIVGLSGFNAGTALNPSWGGWRSFAAIFGRSLRTVHRLAGSKPVQISEVSSVSQGGSQAAWITDMFRYLAAHPQIRSLVWFDLSKQADWRIVSPGSGAAFAAGARLLAPGARADR